MKVRKNNFKYCVGVRGIVNCIFVNKPVTLFFIHRKRETATHHQKLVLLFVYFLMEGKYRGEMPF